MKKSLLTLIFLMFFASHAVAGQQLIASYYSTESLHKEGTWRWSHGQMANGQMFHDANMTCASWDYPLNSKVKVIYGNKSVVVRVTDRTNRRFAGKRIDLSIGAFLRICPDLNKGLLRVNVEKVVD